MVDKKLDDRVYQLEEDFVVLLASLEDLFRCLKKVNNCAHNHHGTTYEAAADDFIKCTEKHNRFN